MIKRALLCGLLLVVIENAPLILRSYQGIDFSKLAPESSAQVDRDSSNPIYQNEEYIIDRDRGDGEIYVYIRATDERHLLREYLKERSHYSRPTYMLDGSVTYEDLMGLHLTEPEITSLWTELIALGYMDNNGKAREKFKRLPNLTAMEISDSYTHLKEEIYDLLQQAEERHSAHFTDSQVMIGSNLYGWLIDNSIVILIPHRIQKPYMSVPEEILSQKFKDGAEILHSHGLGPKLIRFEAGQVAVYERIKGGLSLWELHWGAEQIKRAANGEEIEGDMSRILTATDAQLNLSRVKVDEFNRKVQAMLTSKWIHPDAGLSNVFIDRDGNIFEIDPQAVMPLEEFEALDDEHSIKGNYRFHMLGTDSGSISWSS